MLKSVTPLLCEPCQRRTVPKPSRDLHKLLRQTKDGGWRICLAVEQPPAELCCCGGGPLEARHLHRCYPLLWGEGLPCSPSHPLRLQPLLSWNPQQSAWAPASCCLSPRSAAQGSAFFAHLHVFRRSGGVGWLWHGLLLQNSWEPSNQRYWFASKYKLSHQINHLNQSACPLLTLLLKRLKEKELCNKQSSTTWLTELISWHWIELFLIRSSLVVVPVCCRSRSRQHAT